MSTSGRFSPESLIGTHLGGVWRVSQLLRSGGIAHVYLARPASGDGSRPQHVALKVLRPELEGNREVEQRFEREALASTRVQHENIVRVFEPLQRAGGFSYFATEHLVGVDLADVLASQGRLSAPRALRILMAVCRGLGAAHGAGVVHRDIKPENIFLVHAPDGREVVKVLDFGSAGLQEECARPIPQRITVMTGFVGTPGYMPAEQAEGVVAHPSADVYALGVVSFEVLTGRPPYGGSSWLELVHRHATDPIPALRGISAELDGIVKRAMAKAPADRFASMADFERALSAAPEVGRHSVP